MFWKRFIQEYIPTLNVRRKWSTHQRDFKVNDVVLVKSENLKRSFWPLGRIIEVNQSRDGHIRSVKIKMGNTILIRPTNALCLLEAAQ